MKRCAAIIHGAPVRGMRTMIVSVGHKGRYVGIVGVYGGKARGQPVQLRYELVALDPEYETPPGKDAENPIHALLQKYAEEVKKGNYLAQYDHKGKYPEVQVEFPQATYVGSEKCKTCHEAAYEIWAASPHPHAYETLVNKAKRPNLRQYDGECVVCHVTGFRFVSGFTDEQHTPRGEHRAAERDVLADAADILTRGHRLRNLQDVIRLRRELGRGHGRVVGFVGRPSGRRVRDATATDQSPCDVSFVGLSGR